MTKKNGFTLIELLVTIAIIGILSTVVFISVTKANEKSRDSRRKADLVTMKKALDIYALNNDSYPIFSPSATQTWENSAFCKADNSNSTGGPHTDLENWTTLGSMLAPYLAQLPIDPKYKCTGILQFMSAPAGFSYSYVASSDGKNYDLWAYLENESDPTNNSQGNTSFTINSNCSSGKYHDFWLYDSTWCSGSGRTDDAFRHAYAVTGKRN